MEPYGDNDLTKAWRQQQNSFAHNDSGYVGEDKDEYTLEDFMRNLDDLTKSLENNVNLEELFSEAKKVTSASRSTKPHAEREPRGGATSPLRPLNKIAIVESAAAAATPISNAPSDIPQSSQIASTPEPPTPVRTPLREAFAKTADDYAVHSNNHHGVSNQKPAVKENDSSGIKKMMSLVESIRDVSELQAQQIRGLKQENEVLQLRLQKQERESFPTTPPYKLNTLGRNHPNSRHRSTLKRCSDFTGLVSPGTKFVSELAQVLDLPEEQYAPLSRIMDKHFDRILESRSRNGWNEAYR